MKTVTKITRSFVPLILTFILCIALAETYEEASSASYAAAAAVDVSPPDGYASDAWLRDGTDAWADEVKRREQELYTYLNDTDPARAENYGFRAGQTPALAWNWFDQHPIGYGGMPYVLLQTLLSLDPATCPSSSKWNRCVARLSECFAHRFHIMRRVVGTANDVSRWSFS